MAAAAKRWERTDLDLYEADDRFGPGDAKIAARGKFRSAADCRTIEDRHAHQR